MAAERALDSLELLQFKVKLAGMRIRKRVFVSTGNSSNKEKILPAIRKLASMNVVLFATTGTSDVLTRNGITNTRVHKIADGVEPNAQSLLLKDRIDLVVNILTGDNDYEEQTDNRIIRTLAIENHIPLITDVDVAIATLNRLVDESRAPAKPSPHESWNMHAHFLSLVRDRGGWANYHAHLDKAYLVNPDNLRLGQIDMQEKWKLYDSIKQNYTHEDLYERISRGVEFMIGQGVTHLRTFIDADSKIKLLGVNAIRAVQAAYKDQITLEWLPQALGGVLDPIERKWYEEACGYADLVGGLPSKDRPRPEAHLDVLMQIAKSQGKRVDVHVDQENNPYEDETKLLALKTIEHGMEGRVSAVHSISLACKSAYEQNEIIKVMKDAGLSVIVCPSAALSMKQLEMSAPLHNSIAPVTKFIEAGIHVVMGTDNIYDFFMPMTDGDMFTEVRMLMEATRNYDIETIANIACDKSLAVQPAN